MPKHADQCCSCQACRLPSRPLAAPSNAAHLRVGAGAQVAVEEGGGGVEQLAQLVGVGQVAVVDQVDAQRGVDKEGLQKRRQTEAVTNQPKCRSGDAQRGVDEEGLRNRTDSRVQGGRDAAAVRNRARRSSDNTTCTAAAAVVDAHQQSAAAPATSAASEAAPHQPATAATAIAAVAAAAAHLGLRGGGGAGGGVPHVPNAHRACSTGSSGGKFRQHGQVAAVQRA